MYLVTGGAGFVGSHIVRSLNDRGDTDIVVVDDLSEGDKFINLSDCTIADYMDKSELAQLIESGRLDRTFKAIFHQGACTDTMEYDGLYMMENNYTYSKLLFHYALARQIPFIYASSGADFALLGAHKVMLLYFFLFFDFAGKNHCCGQGQNSRDYEKFL